jgi:hypothetical protein
MDRNCSVDPLKKRVCAARLGRKRNRQQERYHVVLGRRIAGGAKRCPADGAQHRQRVEPMQKLFGMPVLVLASLVSASPNAWAQSTSSNGLSTTTNGIIGTVNGQSSAATGQTGTSTGQSSQSNASSQSGGTICIQEMTATFCNTSSSPNSNGYGTIGAGSGSTGSSSSSGSGSGSGSASAGSGSGGSGANNTSSIPACGGFPAANELCN